MKSNKVKQNYSKYKKVSTNIKGDLLLDDNFLPNHSKEDSLSTDAVSVLFALKTINLCQISNILQGFSIGIKLNINL